MDLKWIVPKSTFARWRAIVLVALLGIAALAFCINVLANPTRRMILKRVAETKSLQIHATGGAPGIMGFPSLRSVIEKDGLRLLPGGPDESDHFDITEFRLNSEQLHYGLGRENFPALIEPEFVTATEADEWIPDMDKVLAVKIGDEVKVYPVNLLMRHEVVNDVVGGRPIFAAYCVLADLGAVYDRQIGDQTLTYAVSGYTYFDPEVWEGLDAFVLWDRETESLWWPPTGNAVSGPMIDTPMKVLEQELWAQTEWGKVKARYPEAVVLRPGQDFTRPTEWTKLSAPPKAEPAEPTDAIAPHWGENTEFLKQVAATNPDPS